MGQYFRIEKVSDSDGIVELKVGFGEPALHPEMLPDAVATMKALALPGGKLIRFNGPCSVLIGMALAHQVAYLYSAVAYYEPKEAKDVVCISHNPDFHVGQHLV